ncbi:MAG: nucleotidyltransferase family protein [Planctomycetes bacterium]|nr:nucleotidyltransferase family protein [Planctomycetota bacterium]
MPTVAVDRRRIGELCRRHHVERLALFGSVLRDDFGPDSDIDVLVEFEPDATVGFLDMAELEQALAEMWGRPVDLRTPAELSPYFRQRVLDEAEAVYVHG